MSLQMATKCKKLKIKVLNLCFVSYLVQFKDIVMRDMYVMNSDRENKRN